jgi:hypothetical protein
MSKPGKLENKNYRQDRSKGINAGRFDHQNELATDKQRTQV